MAFDADIVLALREWAIGNDGQFLDPTDRPRRDKNARRFHIATVNDVPHEELDVPSGGIVRMRILNLDAARYYHPVVEGADTVVAARDGQPLPGGPQRYTGITLAPAQRIDLIVRAPTDAGTTFRVIDTNKKPPVRLAKLTTVGPVKRRSRFPELPPNPIKTPDLARARELSFTFARAEGVGYSLCEGTDEPVDIKWSINGIQLPDRDMMLPPLFGLDLGQSYICHLINANDARHPIHIHGYTFQFLGSNQPSDMRPGQLSDTVLLRPYERMQVAFVADNPGAWCFHCHTIMHEVTGFQTYIHVG